MAVDIKCTKNFKRGWSGGKPPELRPVDKALIAHAEKCEQCKTGMFCEEGKKLYRAIKESFKVTKGA